MCVRSLAGAAVVRLALAGRQHCVFDRRLESRRQRGSAAGRAPVGRRGRRCGSFPFRRSFGVAVVCLFLSFCLVIIFGTMSNVRYMALAFFLLFLTLYHVSLFLSLSLDMRLSTLSAPGASLIAYGHITKCSQSLALRQSRLEQYAWLVRIGQVLCCVWSDSSVSLNVCGVFSALAISCVI